jgi:hypothetical protein
VVSQPSYINALERLDRAGERYADNRSARNRRVFHEEQDSLRAIERKLTAEYDTASRAITRLVCLEPLRSVEAGDFAVRVIDDCDGVEVDFFGWYPTLAEAISDARYVYPRAETLEPEWETK